MKKSNKISVFYIISSVTLLLLLIVGGFYGIYLSAGLSFVRNRVENTAGIASGNTATNVSFGGTVNFSSSMLSVIILSAGLIILSVLDFVSLVRQIILFKQFKFIREAKLEKSVEKKIKSKSSVIVFAFVVDIISFIVGIIGIIINAKTFSNGNVCWLLYLFDGLVSLFSVISIILLIIKLKNNSKGEEVAEDGKNDTSNEKTLLKLNTHSQNFLDKKNMFDIDDIEYKLLKLRQLKVSKIITPEEYEAMRNDILDKKVDEKSENE